MENENNRWAIPGKLVDLMMQDSSFYEEVSKIKNIRSYPVYDQWYDENGLHIEFALAGFKPDDIEVKVYGSELTVESPEGTTLCTQAEESDMIVKGIARRKFRIKFLLHSELDSSKAQAKMLDGLLHITVPPNKNEIQIIKVQS